jgi:hypothetical protein
VSAGDGRPLRLRVEVDAAPSPHLLRAAIERRLAGARFGAGAEDAVAAAVSAAVRQELARRERGAWR